MDFAHQRVAVRRFFGEALLLVLLAAARVDEIDDVMRHLSALVDHRRRTALRQVMAAVLASMPDLAFPASRAGDLAPDGIVRILLMLDGAQHRRRLPHDLVLGIARDLGEGAIHAQDQTLGVEHQHTLLALEGRGRDPLSLFVAPPFGDVTDGDLDGCVIVEADQSASDFHVALAPVQSEKLDLRHRHADLLGHQVGQACGHSGTKIGVHPVHDIRANQVAGRARAAGQHGRRVDIEDHAVAVHHDRVGRGFGQCAKALLAFQQRGLGQLALGDVDQHDVQEVPAGLGVRLHRQIDPQWRAVHLEHSQFARLRPTRAGEFGPHQVERDHGAADGESGKPLIFRLRAVQPQQQGSRRVGLQDHAALIEPQVAHRRQFVQVEIVFPGRLQQFQRCAQFLVLRFQVDLAQLGIVQQSADFFHGVSDQPSTPMWRLPLSWPIIGDRV